MTPISPRLALATLLVLIVSTAAHAQKIKVEFDKSVDFSKFKTYAWDPTPQATAKPVLAANIKAGINIKSKNKSQTRIVVNPMEQKAGVTFGKEDSETTITADPLGPSGAVQF